MCTNSGCRSGRIFACVRTNIKDYDMVGIGRFEETMNGSSILYEGFFLTSVAVVICGVFLRLPMANLNTRVVVCCFSGPCPHLPKFLDSLNCILLDPLCIGLCRKMNVWKFMKRVIDITFWEAMGCWRI
ncbi:hypothetical protein F2P56_014904 [Juglans regia]|uniref:Uncharacterized protein n=1 Tax=Juglans regia TaxID=51240 RepID=A0A834CUR7_JUGRE|nr:hypothetical protein F2P56_014904 [Juglans regia]